jgi:myo-inositol-1(or 4)-monophosphatase
MSEELYRRREFAHRLADAAGNIIRPYFRKRIDVTDKGSAGFYDPVTEADRRAEAAIRDLIQLHYPQDAVLGEELGDVPGTTAYRWVIDPIDGTRAFIAGQPLWGTLIGLERERVPVFGILDQPFLPERFVGFEGSAQLQNIDGITPLTTRECERLADAVICTTHPMAHFNEAERAQFAKVENACRLSRYGGDCYAYGLIAMGFVDLVMEARLAHWDIAPLIPIVEGAGGVLTDWQGKPWHAGANVLAAGDRRIHAQAVELLSLSR